MSEAFCSGRLPFETSQNVTDVIILAAHWRMLIHARAWGVDATVQLQRRGAIGVP
jgi:hypothetical protein